MVMAACGIAFAQETADRLTVPFSDPTRAKTVKINLLHGNITVRGYEGNEVIIEGTPQSSERRGAPAGMRRIPMRSTGLEAEEENNTVRISANALSQYVNMTVQVPRATSLQLKSVNSNLLTVENVEGDIEANCTNGKVALNNVSGSVIAHSLNGGINATINQVRGDKPMSFSTLNGNIDVTLPATIKARMKFKADHGDVFTDFDVTTEPAPKATVEERREGNRGKYRISVDRSVYGTVNGGGTEMSFTTVNGRIYVRKK
jgi:DUF4097 and DUF4098 domain-containing protein YvlB